MVDLDFDAKIASIRGLLWAGLSLFVGTMITSLPFESSAWIVAALALAIVQTYIWPRPAEKHKPVAFAAGSLAMLLCFLFAFRAYSGANYRINYRVCGAPIIKDGQVTDVLYGVEWVNPNSFDVYILPTSRSLNAADRHSELPLGTTIVPLHPSDALGDDGKFTDSVIFHPPVVTPTTIKGTANYAFKYGWDKDNLNKSLVIDGTYTVNFTDNRLDYDFRFTPSSSTSRGYIGSCDMGAQMYGEPVPKAP